MIMRLTEEQLNKVMKKYNTDRLWSFSRMNLFKTSPYSYYLKYIVQAKEDNDNSIYGVMGGCVHTILEKFYSDEIKYEDMLDEFENAWMTNVDILDLKFDRTDEEKNNKIKDKYYKNLKHFFKNHTILEDKPKLEKFIITNIGDFYFQGYIDVINKDKNGVYNIIDWKTSSIYLGHKAEKESFQLGIYAIGLNQMGVPIENIRIKWNFLKYCTVYCEQANGKVKERNIERCELGSKLLSNVKIWLKKFGYKDELDYYCSLLCDSNDLSCLPEEVQKKYVVTDCYVEVPITEKMISFWTKEIIETLTDITLREKDYDETHSDKAFWDSEDTVKVSSYYFANLSGYSANLHKPYKEYLDKLERQKQENDDMLGVVNKSKVNNNDSPIEIEDEDLEWLKYI